MKQLCKTCIYTTLANENVSYNPKDIVFIEGYDLNYIYIVEEGLVKVSKLTKNGDERIIDILGKGDFIALVGALRKDEFYMATAEALNAVVLRRISKEEIIKTYSKNTMFKDMCLDCMVSKSNVLQSQLYNSINDDVEEKIITVLKYLSIKFGKRAINTYSINLPFSKTVLSSIIGIRRETLSRKLTTMQKKGILTFKNNTYKFISD
jgi:CRP/FNR family transcriptional regulator